jgi:CrcB protein
MSPLAWVGVVLLGGVGAVLRFRVDGAIGGRVKSDFPYGTFAVNVSGSFALGLLTGAGATDTALFVAGTGLLGSFTTFSTWMFETERLGEEGEAALGVANLAASIAAGLAAAGAGWALGAVL